MYNAEGKPRVRIVNDSGLGYETKVYIDDVDVSDCFSRVTLTADSRHAVTAELGVPACAVESCGIESGVTVSRVYDDRGDIVEGKRQYTLTLTVDDEERVNDCRA